MQVVNPRTYCRVLIHCCQTWSRILNLQQTSRDMEQGLNLRRSSVCWTYLQVKRYHVSTIYCNSCTAFRCSRGYLLVRLHKCGLKMPRSVVVAVVDGVPNRLLVNWLPQPSADNTDLGLNNSSYPTRPHSIMPDVFVMATRSEIRISVNISFYLGFIGMFLIWRTICYPYDIMTNINLVRNTTFICIKRFKYSSQSYETISSQSSSLVFF